MEELVKEFIETNKKSCFVLDLQELKEESLDQSKIGGLPYLESLEDIPMAKHNGEQMRLLAQINFQEIPDNEVYPKQGILQFWFAQGHDLYGMDSFDQNLQDDWKVIFYPQVNTSLKEDEIEEALNIEEEFFPIGQAYKINFISFEKPLYEYYQQLDDAIEEFIEKKNLEISPKEFLKLVNEETGSNIYSESSMGGHPFFTQNDPREMDSYKDYTELLLQIDSEKDIMWGDSGIGNFFIKAEDLAQGKFDDILYNWDCY